MHSARHLIAPRGPCPRLGGTLSLRSRLGPILRRHMPLPIPVADGANGASGGRQSKAMINIHSLAQHRVRAEYHRREGYRIVIALGLWGRSYEVTVEPTTCTHPFRSFKSLEKAMECADAIHRAEGWPIISKLEGSAA